MKKIVFAILIFTLCTNSVLSQQYYDKHVIILVDQKNWRNDMDSRYKILCNNILKGDIPATAILPVGSLYQPVKINPETDRISLFAIGMTGNGSSQDGDYSHICDLRRKGICSADQLIKEIEQASVHKREIYSPYIENKTLEQFLNVDLRRLMNQQDSLFSSIQVDMTYYADEFVYDFVDDAIPAINYYIVLVGDFQVAGGTYNNAHGQDIVSQMLGNSKYKQPFTKYYNELRQSYKQILVSEIQDMNAEPNNNTIIRCSRLEPFSGEANPVVETNPTIKQKYSKVSNKFDVSQSKIHFPHASSINVDSIYIKINQNHIEVPCACISYDTLSGSYSLSKLNDCFIDDWTTDSLTTISFLFFTSNHTNTGRKLLRQVFETNKMEILPVYYVPFTQKHPIMKIFLFLFFNEGRFDLFVIVA